MTRGRPKGTTAPVEYLIEWSDKRVTLAKSFKQPKRAQTWLDAMAKFDRCVSARFTGYAGKYHHILDVAPRMTVDMQQLATWAEAYLRIQRDPEQYQDGDLRGCPEVKPIKASRKPR